MSLLTIVGTITTNGKGENQMRFKQFEIRKPTCCFTPTPDYLKYNFDLVKWPDDNKHCWSIGNLEWVEELSDFEFRSCGLRYLQYREDGLEEWLLKWCELKKIEFIYQEK